MFKLFIRQWIFALCFLLTPALVFAATQNNSEEQQVKKKEPHVLSPIIVTANKREENIQEVPSSISVVDSTQIQDFGIEEMEDIFDATPNIHITKTGPSTNQSTYASVRGIGSTMGGSPVLGVYVDDVYQPHLEMNLLDVERVEVLRGPQGTLYGRNTEAGVINIVTKDPTNTWEAKAGASYGSYNAMDFKGILSGPIIEDKLLFRLSGNYKTSDNYFTNNFNDSKDVNKYRDLDVRLKVITSQEEAFRVALTLDVQDYWSGGYADFAPFYSDKPLEKINMDYDGYGKKQAFGAALRAEYDFSKVTILSVTSFRTEDLDNENDLDFTPIDNMRFGAFYDNTSISQELRLVSNDATAPYKWLIGTYAFYEEYTRDIDFSMMFAGRESFLTNTDTDTTGIAFFAQGSYTFWDRLELTAGLRYDYLWRKMDYTYTAAPTMIAFGLARNLAGSPGKSFDALLPKVALSYKINDSIRPYASVSRGYKEGGFNYQANIGEPYDSEYTWNYELGVKTQWFDNKLLFNLALFYIEWEDKQVEVVVGGTGTWRFVNAGGATSQGIEAEFTAFPIDGLQIMGSFGYTQAKYTDYEGINPAGNAFDYSGNYLIDVPEYTARLGGAYRFENGIFLGASYNYVGKIHYDRTNSNVNNQNGYSIVDAKIGYEADNFEIYAYANNLFNAEYFTRVVNNNVSGWYGLPGEPQTFGVEFSVSF